RKMLELSVIIAGLATIIALFFHDKILARWDSLTDAQKTTAATQIQTLVNEIKKEFAPEKEEKIKVEAPDNFEGASAEVGSWCRRMTLYFRNKRITKEWDKINVALSKVKKGKENRAQRWADENIKGLIFFQEEFDQFKDAHDTEPDN